MLKQLIITYSKEHISREILVSSKLRLVPFGPYSFSHCFLSSILETIRLILVVHIAHLYCKVPGNASQLAIIP